MSVNTNLSNGFIRFNKPSIMIPLCSMSLVINRTFLYKSKQLTSFIIFSLDKSSLMVLNE